ncbi:DUF72 domain-containing protein [Acidiferrimicrobium sp. IK]|uniref:DUF72 domain-containing protein n=1 Tax=Acidiferrimicrobium sp. IK TaxID=2871700 RepID=UPI0021CB79A5|nr:DUF72 domain-containing protein [Acidiferrimicrobium sp. IK]MCU4183822.1 DUF72 domain-containing protein [Acidiferrimicrobium sp. IK]
MSETLLGGGPAAAAPVALGGAAVRAGTTSWADRSLVRDGGFYPKKTMTARERLAYYCSRFSMAEIATTFRFPPTPELCAQWAERTPDGFSFDVKAWSLLVGRPTLPDSLYPDLQGAVRATARDRRRLYAAHLPADVLEECWARFAHSLAPLRRAGRLGVVTLSYPTWFSPRPEAWDELSRLPRRLPDTAVAVELHNPKWFAGDACDATLEWLEARGIGFVCVDGPPDPAGERHPVVAATSDTAVVRFCGRRAVEGEPWSSPYRYADEELAGWVPAVRDLATSAREVHLILDNCWRSDAVDNAATLLRLLGPTG